MDELTPMEPEYRELPPEIPPQIPCYYGTGVQKPQKKSRLPLVLTLLTVLMALNLITVGASLFADSEAEPTDQKNEPSLPFNVVDDEIRLDMPKKDGLKQDSELTLRGIYDLYAPSSVIVTAYKPYGSYSATGVILTEDGYLLTDASIASFHGAFNVRLFDGTSCVASFVGIDEMSQMAILKIDRGDLSAIELNPELQARAQDILSDILLETQSAGTLNLEVSDVPDQMRAYWGLPEGVIINRLMTTSNAYRAGLRPGDVLLRIGRNDITSVSDYFEALGEYKAGETVRVILYRDGGTYYTDVCLSPEG